MVSRKELDEKYRDKLIIMLGDEKEYMGFLKCVSNIYRYEFRNIVLAYENRGIVKAMAPYDTWKLIGRHVKRGTRGINIYEDAVLGNKRIPVFALSDTDGKKYDQEWSFEGEIEKEYLKKNASKNLKSLIKERFFDMIKLGSFTQIESIIAEAAKQGKDVTSIREFIVSSAFYVVMLRATGVDISNDEHDMDISALTSLDAGLFESACTLICDISRRVLISLRKDYDAIKKEIEKRRDVYDTEKAEDRGGRGERNNLGRGSGFLPAPDKERNSDGGRLRSGGDTGGGQIKVRGGRERGGDTDNKQHDRRDSGEMGANLGQMDAGKRKGEADRLYSGGETEGKNNGGGRYGSGPDNGDSVRIEQADSGDRMVPQIPADGTKWQDSRGNSDKRYTDDHSLGATTDNRESILGDDRHDQSSSFLMAHKSKPVTVTCEWSESAVFEEGKTYSLAEFDRIMKEADKKRYDSKVDGRKKYGSDEAWKDADSESFWNSIGYDKVRFTVNMPDGSSITERQDIGDGNGGIIEYLSKFPKYEEQVKILKDSTGISVESHNRGADIYDKDIVINKFAQHSDWYAVVYELIRSGITREEAIRELTKHISGQGKIVVTDEIGVYTATSCVVGFSYSIDTESGTHIKGTVHGSQIFESIKKYLDTDKVKCEKDGLLYKVSTFSGETVYVNAKTAEKATENGNTKAEVSNFTYDISSYADEYENRGPKARFTDNINAIRLLKTLEKYDRNPTREEQYMLSKYVGWGGLDMVFDSSKSNWEKESRELKELLTEEEYKAARESVTSAFYTSPLITKEINNIITKLGLNGGRLLEPSMGTGNFLGTMAADFKVSGVELDSITGRIAKKLYPEADITIGGYEDTDFRQNEFDAAIGNVPFGNYTVFDKTGRYRAQNLLIHNYFFAKTLDVVKPGGIIAFITSKGTLDQSNPEFRKYMAQRAELVGAIRLPNTAFKKNAGTETTSDIIILQKREHLLGDNLPDWVYTGYTEDGIPVNSYYLDNPHMMLGRMQNSGHFNMTECVPVSDISIPDAIHELVEREFDSHKLLYSLPDASDADRIKPQPDKAESDIESEDSRMYTHVVIDDDIYYRTDGGIIRRELSKKDLDKMKLIIEIKQLSRKMIDLSLSGAEDDMFEPVRIRLNSTYDKFTELYGNINHKSNTKLIDGDIDKYFLLSLENMQADGSYVKSAFFERRTILPNKVIDRVDTAYDALRASICEKGRVDIGYMLSIYRPEKSREENRERLMEELKGTIYKNPDKYKADDEDYGWEAADEYLSGNVREKLAKAEHAAKKDPSFMENVDALRKVQPKDLIAEEISVRLGASWIDPEDYEQFMYELLETPVWLKRSAYSLGHKLTIDYNEITGEYFINNKQSVSPYVLANNTYGTTEKNATELIEDALNQRITTVRYKIDDGSKNGKYVTDQKATLLAREKQDMIKAKFSEWLWSKPERKEKYVRRYNERYNSIRLREYDGSFLEFPGMSKEIKLQPHQVNAVARILFGGNTLLAHVVGAGKTYEMIAAIMEQRRLGIARKPCLVVPKPLIEQMASDFMKLYPAANILVATEKDFAAKKRKLFLSRIATGEFDCVIMSQEQFKKIRISPEREKRLIEEEVEKIDRETSLLRYAKDSTHSVKALETRKKQLSAKLATLLSDISSKSDTDILSFEELGIDALFVDEAHAYKNMPIISKMNVSGIASSNSQAALDMLAKCKYINEISNEHNIVFATGTPVSNTMGELYVMQTYLQPSALRRANVDRFDEWAANFGEVVTELEMNVQGSDFRFKNRFSKFINIPELMTMYKDIADIQTADMLKLPVPELRDGRPIVVASERSELVKLIMDDFCERADRIQSGGVDPTEDNFLKLTNDARLLGTDVRLLPKYMEKYGEYYEDDPGSKLNMVADNVVKEYMAAKEKGIIGTQLVFSDIGTPKSDGRFTVYDFIKAQLVSKGIPESEIAFIHDADKAADSGKARDVLFDKVRNGEIKVLIGSTNKCGTGVNVQDYCVALHHIDCPWRPADIEQREGRAIRRGNKNSEVAIYRYCTIGTFDAYLWNTIENKQKFISQVMTSKAVTRECSDIDDTTLSYAEIKTIATGNPKIKERMNLENEVSRLELLKSSYIKTKKSLEHKINIVYPNRINQYTESLANLQKDIAQAGEYPEEFEMCIGGTRTNERKEAAEIYGEMLLKYNKSELDAGIFLGTYKGFPIYIKINRDYSDFINWGKLYAEIRGAGIYTVELGESGIGNITRIENLVSSFEQKAMNLEDKIAECRDNLNKAQMEYEKPFEREEELKEKKLALKKLNHELELAACQDREKTEAPIVANVCCKAKH